MATEPSFWQRIGIHEWFLNDGGGKPAIPETLTPELVYKYIIEKFKDSIVDLTFAERIVFYHEYIISFNPDDYREFMENKKGIFGLIVQEAVKKFYEILNEYRSEGKTVEPSSNKWVFRFVSHPDYGRGDKGFIGKLLPGGNQKEENLRVTFIPRQTGIAETFDLNDDILGGFTFYSEGYYEVPYVDELKYDSAKLASTEQPAYARFETILPDKAYRGHKVEFFMKDPEIIVSGDEELREETYVFKIPSEWVNTPHLSIRFNKADGKFYLASFGEKTILNEKEIERSELNAASWVELPLNSRMILNGIIGINIFKS